MPLAKSVFLLGVDGVLVAHRKIKQGSRHVTFNKIVGLKDRSARDALAEGGSRARAVSSAENNAVRMIFSQRIHFGEFGKQIMQIALLQGVGKIGAKLTLWPRMFGIYDLIIRNLHWSQGAACGKIVVGDGNLAVGGGD